MPNAIPLKPRWNLCNAPGGDDGKVGAVGKFLASDDQVLVCTHASFRFAVDKFGIEAFDDRLIAVDEFHHVSANPDNKLGAHLGALVARDKVHLVAMTGSYFRGDAEAVLSPKDDAKFDTVTYTYYEQPNGYKYLKTLDICRCDEFAAHDWAKHAQRARCACPPCCQAQAHQDGDARDDVQGRSHDQACRALVPGPGPGAE